MAADDGLYVFSRVAEGVWQIDEQGLAKQYLIVGSERALLVDTGTGIGDLRGAVEAIVSVPYDVVVTHVHNDHFGGAGEFARVFVPKNDMEKVDSITLASRKDYVRRMVESGAVEYQVADRAEYAKETSSTELVPIDEGTTFDLGDRKFIVIGCYGHTEGEIALFDERNEILCSGDMANPIMVLKAVGDDRREVFARWIENLDRTIMMIPDSVVICGGHGMLEKKVFCSLSACGHMYLEGRLNPVFRKQHIYHSWFLDGDGVVIMIG